MGRRSGYRSLRRGLLLVCIAALAPFASAREPAAVSSQMVQRCINDLGAGKSSVRKAAQQKLLAWSADNPQLVVDEGVKAYVANLADPEISSRLREILAEVVLLYFLPKMPGFLGASVAMGQATDPQGELQTAVLLQSIIALSPADQGGLRQGDLILVIDDLDIGKTPDLATYIRYVRSRRPGTTVKLTIRRGELILKLEIKLGEIPQEYLGDPETRKLELQEQFEQWLRERVEKEQPQARVVK